MAGPARRPRRVRVLGARLAVLALVFAVWQLLPQSVLPDYAFGRPAGVLAALVSLISSGTAFIATAETLRTTLLGILVAAPIGILVAFAAAAAVGAWVIEPVTTVLYATPKVGLISLFILWFGLSTRGHFALVLMTVGPVFYYAARQGLSEVDPNTVIAFRLMGAGRLKIARSLVIRSMTPNLLGVTRLAFPIAFGATVFAELRVPVGVNLGALLSRYALALDGDNTVAIMLIMGVVAYILDVAISRPLRAYAQRTGTGIPAV